MGRSCGEVFGLPKTALKTASTEDPRQGQAPFHEQTKQRDLLNADARDEITVLADKVKNGIADNGEFVLKFVALAKRTYSDESLETMRDQCGCLRDLAMIDLLASTGMRVGELVRLNIDDIDFENRECVVFGKGSKERPVYFDARTKIHLKNYLESRTDENPALFVSLLSPYNRLEISGVEVRLRKLGRRLGISKVHPHKFRRTLATRAIDKGMPIEQVQQLLGHAKIDTTMHYAMVSQNNVKISHRKYIG